MRPPRIATRPLKSPRAGVAAATGNYPKQRKLTEATIRFLSRRGMLGTTVRFDVLAIAWPFGAREPTVRHIPHAFEATGRFQMYN